MKDAKQAIGKLAVAATALSVLSATAGIKYWDTPAYRAFDVDCYVPGAVWNYDGIRNAGADQPHSTTTTTWKNLGSSGANNDVWIRYLKQDGSGFANSSAPSSLDPVNGRNLGSWTEDGLTLTGDSELRASGSGSVAKIDTGTDYTIQMLVTATASGQTCANPYLMSVQKDHFAFFVDKANSRVYWKTQNATTANHPFLSGDEIGYMTAILNGTDKTATFFSGTIVPTSGDGFRSFDSVAGKSDNGYCICGYTGNDGQFVGTIHSYRYYKKALSNEEVAWNRVVDERRFFNRAAPLPVTNAVVATSVAASVEPAGTYAVDGRHVFTAPRVATVGNAKYICTGYTLEEWDDATGDWGSATFHARELSCKVEDTDCVRITWKWMDADGLVTYDVSDYVWNGLEVFYDGICNQGTNVAHSTTATNWVNLGSTGSDNNVFVQRLNAAGNGWVDAADVNPVGDRDPGYWTDNGFRLDAEGRFRCNAPGGFDVGTSYSLQMLIDAKMSEQVPASNSAIPFGAQVDTFAFQIRKNNKQLQWKCFKANYPYMEGDAFDYMTAIMRAEDKQTFFDGTVEPTSGTGCKANVSTGYSDTGFCLGGYTKSNVSDLFVGTLKSFRQYDHALSPAEVLQNRKVDDWRYFGKFAETDVIVQSTHPALQGNEPDGEYDVDGSHTFTAPANVTIKVNGKAIEYACAGYTVESGMWDTRGGATYIVCSNAQTVVSTSYTYNESAGLVRLTWLWKPVRGLRTAADYGFDDYSQAGLVWNYDGIFNAGVGTHDPSATTWKNLGDRANSDLHWNSATSTGHWTDDGYVFAGGPRFKGNAGFILKNCTMQTLIDGNPADQTATTTDHAYFFNGSGSYFNFRLIKGSFDGSAANSLCWVAQNNMYMYFHAPGNQYSFATGIQDFDNKKAMMFPDTTIPTEYVKDGTYGAQRLYHEFTSMNIVTDSGYGLGNVNAGNTGFNGTVKFFRYYDRVLTAEEIVRNRNADAARYFGALGVTNVLVRTKYGDGGVQAESGAYAVEGSWTFTATTVKDRSGNIVPVAGCYIEELDANGTWKNKTWHEGATYTYTTGTDPKTVRLTWSNPPPGTWIILR